MMSILQKIVRAGIVALGLAVLALAAWRITRLTKEGVVPVTPNFGTVQDFSLTERSGKTLTRADLLGQWWVADFVFTRCMGPCPILTTAMSRLQSEFREKQNLKLVSFSVDPEYDTPAVLTAYASSYGADPTRWYFLTGPRATVIDLIRKSFKLAVDTPENSSAGSGTDILHSLSFVLVDPEGRVRGYFNSTDPDAMLRLRDRLKSLS